MYHVYKTASYNQHMNALCRVHLIRTDLETIISSQDHNVERLAFRFLVARCLSSRNFKAASFFLSISSCNFVGLVTVVLSVLGLVPKLTPDFCRLLANAAFFFSSISLGLHLKGGLLESLETDSLLCLGVVARFLSTPSPHLIEFLSTYLSSGDFFNFNFDSAVKRFCSIFSGEHFIGLSETTDWLFDKHCSLVGMRSPSSFTGDIPELDFLLSFATAAIRFCSISSWEHLNGLFELLDWLFDMYGSLVSPLQGLNSSNSGDFPVLDFFFSFDNAVIRFCSICSGVHLKGLHEPLDWLMLGSTSSDNRGTSCNAGCCWVFVTSAWVAFTAKESN